MNLDDLKKKFSNSLSEKYPKEEIQSFFSLLTEEFLNFSRLEIALNPKHEVQEDILENYYDAIERLTYNEPVQYILGYTDFFGHKFKVDKNVLIPRPETEELVSWIIDDVKNKRCGSDQLNILDIGTGSGCIAITLAKNLPNANVDALDLSKEALKVAHFNSDYNDVSVNYINEDILKCESLSKYYDIIVSNPPYVTISEKVRMKPNVLDYEPGSALFVPKYDPLLFFRKIASLGCSYLNPGGSIYFELNEYLSSDLMDLLEKEGFSNLILRKDIYGKDRMIKCELDEQT